MKLRYFIIACILLLAGCTNKVEEKKDINVVTSFYPIYIFTKNVAANVPNVKVFNMSDKHVGCLHDYQLSTSNMKLIEDCDIFITNGAGEEYFVKDALKNKPNLEVIKASEGIELIKNKFEAGDNEHTWLSITNAVKQVENIKKVLVVKDPKNKEIYEKNAKEYIEKLEDLREELMQMLEKQDKIKIVTTHDAFPYFAEDFGIEITDVVEHEEGKVPTPKEMKAIIENIKKNDVKGIFIEPDYSDKLIQTIAKESDTEIYMLNSVTSGRDNLDSYEDIMRKNIETIADSVAH